MEKIWVISGKDLETLEIVADCFDNALYIARKTTGNNYTTGQLK